jgi:hypothetical protein
MLPFRAEGSSAAARDVKHLLDMASEHGHGKRPGDVSCSRSHALDYVNTFSASYNCTVGWMSGGSDQLCVFSRGSRAFAASIPGSCENAAQRGWGRSQGL